LSLSNFTKADLLSTSPEEIRNDLKKEKVRFSKAISHLEKSRGFEIFNPKEIEQIKKFKSELSKCTEEEKGKCSILKRRLNLATRGSRKLTRPLQSTTDIIDELGDSIEEFNNKENLLSLYQDFYENLKPTQRRGLFTPQYLTRLNYQEIQNIFNNKVYPLMERINEGLQAISQNNLQSTWPINKCDEAIGANHIDQNTTDGAMRCSFDQLADDGILKNNNFSLRSVLPCVKDQQRRGTCTAFATVGALEIKMFKNRNQEYNLSEQMTYLYNEIYGDFSGRYTYGLNTMKGLKKLKKKGAKIPLEKDWIYNPSRYIEDYNDSTKKYPKSCTNYSGQKCTGRAFQANEKKEGLFKYTYTIPRINRPFVKIRKRKSFMNVLNPKGSLENAINYLKNGDPVIVSFGVRPSFMDAGSGTNYIQYKKEDKDGGHAAILVGFVYNKDLPSGAPKAVEKGYFVLRNSWGTDFGDCGYVYVDFKHLRKYAYGLATIKYSYFN
jgi:C1A family cysteine protease